MGNNMIEDRVPFIAAIITNFIVVGIAFLFFEDYFYLTVAITLISIFITAKLFNPWALMASVLIALSAGAIEKNDTALFYLILGLFLLGTIFQLTTAMSSNRSLKSKTGSTLSINTLFALLGVGFSYGLIYWIYQNYYDGSLTNGFEAWRTLFSGSQEVASTSPANDALELGPISAGWLTIMGTFFLFSLEPQLAYMQIDPALRTDWLQSINVMAQSFARIFLLGPLTWAALLASMSENRFRLFRLSDLINRFLAGVFSINRVGCLAYLVFIGLLASLAVFGEMLSRTPKMLDYLILAIIGTIIISLSLGTAYSVTRNK
jgi:hypothetical protein